MEQFIDELLKKLTLDQKIELCRGRDSLCVGGIAEHGIGVFTMCDGPQGIRLEDGRRTTALPTGMSLACTFDDKAAEAYGALIGRECNSLNVQSILGPSFNLMRTPLNGRNFEYYGEDPVLAGRIAAGYVRGCQQEKVAATPKHIALNNQEICRTTGSSNVDERTLQELYLRSFEIVTKEAQPWMMMSSYNKINGVDASACGHVQQELAKDAWGFDGVMVSDWGGAHDPKGCALGGLDLEMGSACCFGDELKKLVESGEVPESAVDEKARRILRLFYRSCIFTPENRPAGEPSTPRHHEISMHLAAQGMVLLKNENNTLPLKRDAVKKLALIGPSANFFHCMGGLENCGGSGAVHPEYEITPLAGLRDYLGDAVEITYAPGVLFDSEQLVPAEALPGGVLAEFFDDPEKLPGEGDQPFLTRTVPTLDNHWGDFLAAGLEGGDELATRKFGLRLTGTLVPLQSGKVSVSLNASRFCGKFYLDGKLVSELKPCEPYPADGETELEVTAGVPLNFRLEGRRISNEFSEIKVLWKDDAREAFDRAVALAREADCVLFVGGTNHRYDREAIGWGDVPNADIPDLELPSNQSELIQALAAANPNTVVALVNGSVVNVEPWIDRVAALLECWYPGMENGRALARVLFGELEPEGRLCCTWAKALNDYACHANGAYPGVRGDVDPHVDYPEGIFIGYRHAERAKIEPRFPFGYGLGYTTMTMSLERATVVRGDLAGHDVEVEVAVRVTNTGNRAGAAVVQLYVGDDVCSVERPVKELQKFAKLRLAPGESKQVILTLDWRDFAFYSEAENAFTVEPGSFTLGVGSSCRDIAGTAKIEL